MTTIEHPLSRKARWYGAALGLLATPLLVWAGNSTSSCEFCFTVTNENGSAKSCSTKDCASGEGCSGIAYSDRNGNLFTEARCVTRNPNTPMIPLFP